MARRSRIDIITDILSSAQEKKEIKPTHLMYKANMSHSQMMPYLDELVQKNFIRKTRKGGYEYLIITDKGCKFLQKTREMKEFQKAFGV